MRYTDNLVERLLRNYLDIRATLEGNTQRLHDTYIVDTKRTQSRRERPLGQVAQGEPWPFMETKHAKVPQDGKAKARFLEELLCAVIDIEQTFPRLSNDDKELLLKYHITHGYTLDELMVERGVTSRGSMRQRVARSVTRLTRILNE